MFRGEGILREQYFFGVGVRSLGFLPEMESESIFLSNSGLRKKLKIRNTARNAAFFAQRNRKSQTKNNFAIDLNEIDMELTAIEEMGRIKDCSNVFEAVLLIQLI